MLVMRIILIICFLFINTARSSTSMDNKVCNYAVRLNTGIALQVVHTLYDIKEYFRPDGECGK